MKINQIFKSLMHGKLYDPRHLYEDFKREQVAIMEATPKFKIPKAKASRGKSERNKKFRSQSESPLTKDTASSIDIKPSKKDMPSFAMPDINPAAKKMGGKVTGASKQANLSQETLAKRDADAKEYKGEFSGQTRAPQKMSSIPRKDEFSSVDPATAASIQQVATQAAAAKEQEEKAREEHREAGGIYHASGTKPEEGKTIAGDEYLSSASKVYLGRDTGDGYKATEVAPGQKELENIDSETGLEKELKTRAGVSSGDYVSLFQKQRSAHAKDRGVPMITGSNTPEEKAAINQLAVDAKASGTEEFAPTGKQTTSRRKDTQAMTDLYDTSVNFLITTARKVISKAGLSGAQQQSALDDAFQEASAQWFDAVGKYKPTDGDFENFMRAHVSRGIKNWAQTELQGAAPISRHAAGQATRLNKIKGELQQQGVPEEEILTVAAERWNEQEDEAVAQAAAEGKTIKPKYTDAARLRKLETSRGFWGSSDEEIEGEEGAIGTVGSLAPGGDPGDVYGEFGSSAEGAIGSGGSAEEDIEQIGRQSQLGGSFKGLQQLKNMMVDAGIEGDEREIFSRLWGFGGQNPQSEKQVSDDLELSPGVVRRGKNAATAKVVNYLRDVVGWEENEIRNYLEDTFDERIQLFNLTTKPAFEPSTKKAGGDVISRDRKRAVQQLASLRDKRAAKKGPKRSAERKARQAEAMPTTEFTASDEPGVTTGKMDPMKGGKVGAQNYEILKKRYAGVEKALGRLGDDATEDQINAWYDKANRYLTSTYGLDVEGPDEVAQKKQIDFTSKEFLDKAAAAKEAKLRQLYDEVGKARSGLDFDGYKSQLSKSGSRKTAPPIKKYKDTGDIDYSSLASSEHAKTDTEQATEISKKERVQSYMDTLGISREEAEAEFNKRFKREDATGRGIGPGRGTDYEVSRDRRTDRIERKKEEQESAKEHKEWKKAREEAKAEKEKAMWKKQNERLKREGKLKK